MKRFAFSLERMLAFKRTMYEKERNILAQLRAQRLSLEMRREDTERQLLAKDAEFRQKAAEKGVGIGEVTSMSFHRESADRLVALLQEQIAQLDIEIDRQIQVVVELDKEVKSLEKLREKQWDEYVAEAMREENERILELVSGRFAQQQKEAEDQPQ